MDVTIPPLSLRWLRLRRASRWRWACPLDKPLLQGLRFAVWAYGHSIRCGWCGLLERELRLRREVVGQALLGAVRQRQIGPSSVRRVVHGEQHPEAFQEHGGHIAAWMRVQHGQTTVSGGPVRAELGRARWPNGDRQGPSPVVLQ